MATKKIAVKTPAKKPVKASVAAKSSPKKPATKVLAKKVAAKPVAKAPAKKVAKTVVKAIAKKDQAKPSKVAARKTIAKAPVKKIAKTVVESSVKKAIKPMAKEAAKPVAKVPPTSLERPPRVIMPDVKKGKLSKTELKFYKKSLIALRDMFSQKDATARQNVKHHNEADTKADYGCNAFDKFLAYGRAGSTNDILMRIDEALARIENGTYGTCLMCGGPIRRVRLEVQPFSRYCIKCQEMLEKETRGKK